MQTVLLLFMILLFSINNSVIIDFLDSYPSYWTELHRTDGEKKIDLVFAIKQRNSDRLKEELLEISTPGNSKYGNFMSMDEINNMLAPNPKHLIKINEWLFSELSITPNKIKYITMNNDTMSININIKSAEKLLSCKYYDYMNNNNNDIIVSRIKMDTNYNVPSDVADYIDFITPTIRFPSQSSLRIFNNNNNNIDIHQPEYNEVNPIMLQYMYGSYGVYGESPSNKMAISSFQAEGVYEKQDIVKFWTIYNISAGNLTNVPPTQRSQSEVECSLDLEYITSMGQLINTEAWWTDGTFSDALLTWTTDVLKRKNPPLLFSVSYSISQLEVGEAYCNRLDTNLAAMGAQGISVLFASGDSGAGGGCTAPQPYIPQYPCASPYVTCVGGVTNSTTTGDTKTDIMTGTTIDESAWINGGGGFSIYSPIQSWQKQAVESFLDNNNNLPPSQYFNSSGRGYPDMSAQSEYFAIIDDQMQQLVSGTSASTPTVSGIFALLNDLRLQNNMKQMGFLNPFIYQIASNYSDAFNDCTKGFNEGCDKPKASKAFQATKGWDASSGWGSPNYKSLAKYVLQTGKQTKK